MKLIYAIINNDDSLAVATALSRDGFYSTKLASTGNFLMKGNTTFLIATEAEKVDRAITIIKNCSQKRTEMLPPAVTCDLNAPAPIPVEVTVGGATIFVTDIERFEKV